MNTTECIKLIELEDISALSRLIDKPGDWKRINKFNYKNGKRRYLYLTNSIVLATVDEVDGQATVVVRPPMLWELYLLQDIRSNDEFLGEAINLHDDHYDFCDSLSCPHSEPEQYSFVTGVDHIGWIRFEPIRYTGYDQHLSGELDNILPESMRNNEVMECTYSFDELDINTMTDDLVVLGFKYTKE